MASRHLVHIGRIYDDPRPSDGARVLVDRLWPRGLAKERVGIDAWERVIAPSDELRKWYGHDPAKFTEFRKRYQAELTDPERSEALGRLRQRLADGPLTLLTATRDVDRSQARVLADMLGAADDRA